MTYTPGHQERFRERVTLMALAIALSLVLLVCSASKPAFAASNLPEIRMTGSNQVPACVTPERLMSFLRTRNSSPDPRFSNIADHYKKLGEGWRVRWDYAFFQMALETNFLTYKQGNGRWGDVNPKQNNFAGIGTTGGGVPGDSFPDVKSGVLGHIQHLVAYSGERVVDPVAPRTKLKQDDIIELSEALNRPVTFKDLARRWAVDPAYAKSMSYVAEIFMRDYCKGVPARPVTVANAQEKLPWMQAPVRAMPLPVAAKKPPQKISASARPVAVQADASPSTPVVIAAPKPVAKRVPQPKAAPLMANSLAPAPVASDLPGTTTANEPALRPSLNPAVLRDGGDDAVIAPAAKQAAIAPAGLGMTSASPCQMKAATYGGSRKTVLVKSKTPTGEPLFVALGVLDGFEQSMTDSFLKTQPAGAEAAGEFGSKAEALAKATELCTAG